MFEFAATLMDGSIILDLLARATFHCIVIEQHFGLLMASPQKMRVVYVEVGHPNVYIQEIEHVIYSVL